VFLDFGERVCTNNKVKKWRLKIIDFGRTATFEAYSFRTWTRDTLHDLMMQCGQRGRFGFWHIFGRILMWSEFQDSRLGHCQKSPLINSTLPKITKESLFGVADFLAAS
jgi:hypothetical protein